MLGIILHIGNRLNTAGESSNAKITAGLTLESLKQLDQVKAFEKLYIEELNKSHRKVLDTIKSGKLTDEVLDTLNAVAAKIAAQFE